MHGQNVTDESNNLILQNSTNFSSVSNIDTDSEKLNRALEYINRHQFDPVVNENVDEEGFFSSIDNMSSVSMEPIQTPVNIVEDDNTTESFDDIGLF